MPSHSLTSQQQGDEKREKVHAIAQSLPASLSMYFADSSCVVLVSGDRSPTFAHDT